MTLLDALTTPMRSPAECVITVDGQEITDLYAYLAEVSVETNRKAGWTASLKFETRRNLDGTWIVEDSGVLEPWAEVKIEAAFGASHTEEVFRGYIKEIKTNYPENSGGATVIASCLDQSMAMDRKHERKEWGEDGPGDDTSLLTAISGNVGLAPHEDNGTGQSGIHFNQDDTDIKLLEKRAEANGYELIVAEGKIYFGEMRLDHAPQDTIVVYGGRSTNCVRFGVEDLADKPDKVAFEFPGEQTGDTVERIVSPNLFLLGNEPSSNTAVGLPEYVWKLTRQGRQTESELQILAQRKVNEESFKVKAQGELDGSLYGHVLQVGLPVGVDGVGERYGGIYYTDAVRHTFNMQGYRQTFTLIRNAYGNNLGAASGLSGAVAAAL